MPISWSSSASGDRFPIGVDVSHPLWRSFLESGSLSPTVFFRALLGPPRYFNSPTPWQSNRRLAQKVSELMDSFRPGYFVYRPFKQQPPRRRRRRSGNNNNRRAPRDEENEEEVQRIILGEQDENQRPPGSPINPVRIPLNLDDSSRHRLLYLDIGRPRPFYRRNREEDTTEQREENEEAAVPVGGFEPKSLEELSKISLVRGFGLARLRSLLLAETELNLFPRLPSRLRDHVLTFLCRDFKEVTSSADPLQGQDKASIDSPSSVASYTVRCLHDNNLYRAVFATSEVDKHASYLWDDHRFWLQLSAESIRPILALAADPLTENVFFIVEQQAPRNGERRKQRSSSLEERSDSLKVNEGLKILNDAGFGDNGDNPLLCRKFREFDPLLTDKDRIEICQAMKKQQKA